MVERANYTTCPDCKGKRVRFINDVPFVCLLCEGKGRLRDGWLQERLERALKPARRRRAALRDAT